MRRASLVLAGLVWTAAVLLAQPPAPVPFDPKKYPEDWLLAKWEDAMSKVDSLVADCQFTSVDKVFNAKSVYTGTNNVKYLRTKVAVMASLELYKEDKKGVPSKDQFKKFVFTGNFLYNFMPETKVIQVVQLPNNGPSDNNLLSFIFGMKAADAKQRYDLKWQPPDQNYYYLEITPKFLKDKQDFKQARLVFQKTNFLVRQVYFVEANGNTVIWEFPRATVNVALKATEFGVPQLPAGWRMEKGPSLNQVGAAPK